MLLALPGLRSFESSALRRRARNACLAAGLVVSAAGAPAAVVQLEFTGTYDTQGNTLFGQTGAAVAYHYRISYDTALNTNTNVFRAGQALGPTTAGSPLYGYSRSGIVASSVSFGSQTWLAANLQGRTIAPGIAADLWFDTDIGLATPATAWMYFDSGSGNTLALGQGWGTLDGVVLGNTSSVGTRGPFSSLIEARGTVDIGAVPAASVSEPGTLVLAALGLLAARWRERRQRCHAVA